MEGIEIELRCWDNDQKRFRDDNESKQLLAMSSNINTTFGIPTNERFKKRFIFELYTTRKDRNGKKIFQGDIVKWGHWEYEVVFFNGSFELHRPNDHRGGISPEKSEIIGNIHEQEETHA